MDGQAAGAVAVWAQGTSAWVLVWLLKGSLLLALLFPLAALLRRSSSSARHIVWTAGLAVMLALPLVSYSVLPWRLELPIGAGFVSSLFPTEAADASQATMQQADVVDRAGLDDLSGPPSVRSPDGAAVVGSSVVSTPIVTGRRTLTRVWWSGMTLLQFGVLVWAAGAAMLLVWLGRSAIRARRLVRTGTALTDPSWTTALMEAADRLDLPELPRLLVNADAAVPLTCGIVRPSIVLPPSSETWSDERRRAVLCHELGHIRRRDLMSHLLGRLSCALYWFQPLAWSAARRMRAESERACDDLVLMTGTRASAYADHLLQIASAGRGARAPAVALPMAQPREFEARLLSILEPGTRREPLSHPRSAALAGLVLLLALPLAALSPERSAPAQSMPPDVSRNAREQDPVTRSLRQDTELPAPSVLKSGVSAVADGGPSDGGSVVVDTPAQLTRDPGDVTAPADTGRRDGRRSFDRDIERGAEALAESVADITVSTFGQVFRSLLGQTDSGDPRVRASLREALHDPEPEVRRVAAWALGSHPDSAVVRALADALRSDVDERVREMSAWALAELNAPSKDDLVVDALAQAVASDTSGNVRSTAAWALGNARASRAVSALERSVQSDAAAPVRAVAAWALGTIGATSSLAALSAAMTFDDADVRETAAWAIGTIDPDQAPDRLAAGLRDPAPKVRKVSAWALGRIADPATAPALQDALSDDNTEVRSAVVWALGRLPDGVSTDALAAALRDAEPDVRAAAAAALGGHGSNPWPWPRPWPRPRPSP